MREFLSAAGSVIECMTDKVHYIKNKIYLLLFKSKLFKLI
jgi:hypothetical protein